MSMDGGIPIVGMAPSDQEQVLIAYMQTMEAFIKLHQQHVGEGEGKLNAEYQRAAQSEDKRVNGLYIETLHARIATHAAAISNITGHLALLAALGVPNIPAPPGMEIAQDEESLN